MSKKSILFFLFAILVFAAPNITKSAENAVKLKGNLLFENDSNNYATGVIFSNGDVMTTMPKDGKTLLNGSGPPSGFIANPGDFYVDIANHILYGPYIGSWPAGVSLVGPQGPQGLQGIQGAQGPAGIGTAQSVGALVNSAAKKSLPADTDIFALMDSSATFILKKLTWADLKSALKTYFDSLYVLTPPPPPPPPPEDPPYDWYVDSVNGNDSNSGKTPDQAYKTIGALSGKIAANQNIGLAAGSHWREQLSIAVNNVTVASYGTGAKPLLDCSDVIPSGAWTKTEGYTNVYQVTLSSAYNVPSNPDWYTSAWENDSRYVIKHSIANVDTTSGSYYPVLVNPGTITLYVHASDNASPSGKTMEYSARWAGIYAQGYSGITLTGLRTRRNIHANGSIIVGKDSRITDCIVEEGNKHNIFFDSGAVLTRVHAKGFYYEGLGATSFVGFGNQDLTRGFDFIDCTATHFGLADPGRPGFFTHGSSPGQYFSHVNFQNCTGLIAFSGCINVTISNCTSSGVIKAYDASTLTITDSNITFSGSDQYGVHTPTNIPSVVSISNTTITGPVKSGSPGTTCVFLPYANQTLTITGSTLRTATNAITSKAATISTGNTFDIFTYNYQYWGVAGGITSDYNTFNNAIVNSNNAYFMWIGTVTNYAGWKTYSGQDSNSTPSH